VSTYAEMDRLRKKERPLYLEVRAIDLEVRADEDAEDPTGYVVVIGGLRSIAPTHADRLRRRIEEAKPGLLKVLWATWDEDLEAIRGEGKS
jgi:hypothetical protein